MKRLLYGFIFAGFCLTTSSAESAISESDYSMLKTKLAAGKSLSQHDINMIFELHSAGLSVVYDWELVQLKESGRIGDRPALKRRESNTLDEYRYLTTAYDWFDVSGIGNEHLLDDDGGAPLTLPFSFWFYGTAYTSMMIGSNGYLELGGTGASSSLLNTELPSASAPNNIIAMFWDDLNSNFGTQGHIYSYHDVANGRFVIQYQNVEHFSSGDPETFQCFLYNNGDIVIQWQIVSNAGDCTVGIENADGSEGVQVCYNTEGVDCPANETAVIINQPDGIPLGVTDLTSELNDANVSLAWTDPSQDTNGNAITPDNIQIWLGIPDVGTLLGTVGAGVQAYSHLNAPSGRLTYYVRAFLAPYYGSPVTTTIMVGNPSYDDDFNLSDGQWVQTGGAVWEWGAPAWLDGPTAHSAPNVWGSFLAGDYVDPLLSATLDLDVGLTIDNAAASIEFWAWWEMESGFDGCNMKISVDGGSNWDILVPDGGYPDTISTDYASPIAGEPAWTGTAAPAWTLINIPLAAFVGQTPIFRFHFATDDSYQDYAGFYFDDMAIWGLGDTVEMAEWISWYRADNAGNPVPGEGYTFSESLVADGRSSIGCVHSAFSDPRESPDWQGWTSFDMSGAGNYVALVFAEDEVDNSFVDQTFDDFVVGIQNPATGMIPAGYNVFCQAPAMAPDSCRSEVDDPQWIVSMSIVSDLATTDTVSLYFRARIDPRGPEPWEEWLEGEWVALSGSGKQRVAKRLPSEISHEEADSIQIGVGFRAPANNIQGNILFDLAALGLGDPAKAFPSIAKESIVPDITQDSSDYKYIGWRDSHPGVPDSANPYRNRVGGTCLASALANCLWYWSRAAGGFPAITDELTGADSLRKMESLAEELTKVIYDSDTVKSPGIESSLKKMGVLHKKDDNPEKLLYERYSIGERPFAYWDSLKSLLERCVDVILMVEFIDSTGAAITDSSGNSILHHVTLSNMTDYFDGFGCGLFGWSASAKLRFSNPWGVTRGEGKYEEVDVSIGQSTIGGETGITSRADNFLRIQENEKGIRIVAADLIYKPSQRSANGGNIVSSYSCHHLDEDVAYAYTAYAPTYFSDPVYAIGLYLDVPYTESTSPTGWTVVPFPTYQIGHSDCIHELTGGGLMWMTETNPILPGDSLSGFSITVDSSYPNEEGGIIGFVLSDSSRQYLAFALDGPVPIPVLAAPQIVISRSDDDIILNWHPIPQASSYSIYWSATAQGAYSLLINSTDTTHTHAQVLVESSFGRYYVEALP